MGTLLVAGVPAGAQLERAVLELPPAAVEMRAAALLMSGQEGGDLDLLARSFAGPGLTDLKAGTDDGIRTILTVVEIDGIGVLEAARAQESAGGRPRLEVFVYAVGPSLDVVDAVALRLDRPVAHEAQLLDAGVRVLAPLCIDFGRAAQGAAPPEIRVLARVGESFGLRRIEMPSEGGTSDGGISDSGTSEPDDLDRSGRWLVAWSSERPADEPESGLAFDPASAQPSAFQPPPELADAAGSKDEPWPSLMRRHGSDVLTGVMPTEAAEIQLPEELGRRLQAVLDGYVEAVSMRANGDTHGAAYFLAELEAKAMDELGADGLTLLLGQEVRGFQRLRSRLDSVQPLISLIRLHLDVSDEHRRAGRYLLGSFAMSSAVRITDWYAEEAERGREGDEIRAEVAAILTSLAGEVQVRGTLGDAVGLYRRALGHRSDEPIALFGLATVLAKVGEPDEAAKLYEQLVETQPGHHEARLRWAVMLQRLGGGRNLAKARSQYRHLTAQEEAGSEPVPDWVASLAAQQLVRLDLDAGDLDAAARSLDAALARWPDLRPLRMASIRLAEMRGERDAVAERLEYFEPGAAGSRGAETLRPGGRTRFHEAPNAGLRGLKARLSALEASRHAELAEAAEAVLAKRGRGPSGRDRGGAP